MADSRWLRLDAGWMDSEWLAVLSPGARLSWVSLLSYTKLAGTKGSVKALSPAVAAKRWDIPEEDVQEMLDAAQSDGALSVDEDGDWIVTAWSRYQEPDSTANRRQRDRRRRLKTGEGWADGKSCEACGATDDLTRDHIVPHSKGGTDDDSNIRVLCRSCNSRRKNDPSWDDTHVTRVTQKTRVTSVTGGVTRHATETETETETGTTSPLPPTGGIGVGVSFQRQDEHIGQKTVELWKELDLEAPRVYDWLQAAVKVSSLSEHFEDTEILDAVRKIARIPDLRAWAGRRGPSYLCESVKGRLVIEAVIDWSDDRTRGPSAGPPRQESARERAERLVRGA